MSHRIFAGLGMAAGGLFAAGLISLTTGAVAHADGDDGSPGVDPDFMTGPLQDFGLFTNQSFADPSDNEFVATVLQIPQFGITDILTSGSDPSGSVGFGTAGVGTAGETVNTFVDTMNPAMDFTLAIPFTDPLAVLFTDLLQFGF